MKKIYNLILIMFCAIFSTMQVPKLQNTVSLSTQNQLLKNNNGITEEDFINTMFLKSEFFENWSDTNYFINPTLKTSKSLTYNKDWYLDYIKDSFSTGVIIETPSVQFMDLYNNYENIINNYFSTDFYNKDDYKGFYLRDFLLKPMQYKNLFLKNIYYVFLNLIGTGAYFDWPPMELSPVYVGFDNDILQKSANDVDNKLAKFNYFDYEKFSSFGVQYWNDDYFYISKEIGEKFENFSNGYLSQRKDEIRQHAINFLTQFQDVIINELLRVQSGGSSNYEFIDANGTERIIFEFETVNEQNQYHPLKENYQLSLTINEQYQIRAGSLHFINKYGGDFQVDRLNFELDFIQKAANIYFSQIKTFSYDSNNKETIYENIFGNLNVDEFLKRFFSNALIPIFENRSSFIQSGYLDNLTYDTVMLNFFGLKDIDFNNLLTDDSGKVINQWNGLISNVITISKSFYRDYIMALFDMDNNTYVQGFNQEYGLIANNGFKIYPQYFYYSDKYQNLNFKLYSSYNNRFYDTNYGKNFNFDYSVMKSFDTSSSDDYVFPKPQRDKYLFKYVKDVDSRNIGYNVFTLSAQKHGNMYRYYDFNFGIYNWQEITKDGLFPENQWWEAKYESCSWYNLMCHIKNAVIWIVNNIPGIKEGNQLANGIGYIFKNTYLFFDQIFSVWKFSPALYNTVTNLFLLIIFMKLVRLF